MTERPILFSGPMVREILDGRKTQTRRAVKPQPQWVEADNAYHAGGGFRGTAGWRYVSGSRKRPADFTWAADEPPAKDSTVCPYGQPGDRLWVRETWATERSLDHLPITGIPYNARTIERLTYFPSIVRGWHKARPSIHMPRWASRLTLEITDVRVERLQDISRADAKAEGFLPSPGNGLEFSNGRAFGNANLAFRDTWDSLNAKRGLGWDANPWVWVIEFRRLP